MFVISGCGGGAASSSGGGTTASATYNANLLAEVATQRLQELGITSVSLTSTRTNSSGVQLASVLPLQTVSEAKFEVKNLITDASLAAVDMTSELAGTATGLPIDAGAVMVSATIKSKDGTKTYQTDAISVTPDAGGGTESYTCNEGTTMVVAQILDEELKDLFEEVIKDPATKNVAITLLKTLIKAVDSYVVENGGLADVSPVRAVSLTEDEHRAKYKAEADRNLGTDNNMKSAKDITKNTGRANLVEKGGTAGISAKEHIAAAYFEIAFNRKPPKELIQAIAKDETKIKINTLASGVVLSAGTKPTDLAARIVTNLQGKMDWMKPIVEGLANGTITMDQMAKKMQESAPPGSQTNSKVTQQGGMPNPEIMATIYYDMKKLEINGKITVDSKLHSAQLIAILGLIEEELRAVDAELDSMRTMAAVMPNIVALIPVDKRDDFTGDQQVFINGHSEPVQLNEAGKDVTQAQDIQALVLEIEVFGKDPSKYASCVATVGGKEYTIPKVTGLQGGVAFFGTPNPQFLPPHFRGRGGSLTQATLISLPEPSASGDVSISVVLKDSNGGELYSDTQNIFVGFSVPPAMITMVQPIDPGQQQQPGPPTHFRDPTNVVIKADITVDPTKLPEFDGVKVAAGDLAAVITIEKPPFDKMGPPPGGQPGGPQSSPPPSGPPQPMSLRLTQSSPPPMGPSFGGEIKNDFQYFEPEILAETEVPLYATGTANKYKIEGQFSLSADLNAMLFVHIEIIHHDPYGGEFHLGGAGGPMLVGADVLNDSTIMGFVPQDFRDAGAFGAKDLKITVQVKNNPRTDKDTYAFIMMFPEPSPGVTTPPKPTIVVSKKVENGSAVLEMTAAEVESTIGFRGWEIAIAHDVSGNGVIELPSPPTPGQAFNPTNEEHPIHAFDTHPEFRPGGKVVLVSNQTWEETGVLSSGSDSDSPLVIDFEALKLDKFFAPEVGPGFVPPGSVTGL